MANFLIIENEIPLNFVDVNRSLPDIYNFKHFDSWKQIEQVLSLDDYSDLAIQKWQNSDTIYLQIKSSYDPINIKIIDYNGLEVSALNQAMNIVKQIGSTIYLQSATSLAILPTGLYKMQIIAGDPIEKTLETDWLYIKNRHENTILHKYSHNSNTGVLFETGIYFLLRVDATLKLKGWQTDRTTYVDTPNNSKTIKGKTARVFDAIYGNEAGFLPYLADKIETIYTLNNKELDGKPFTANGTAKLEPKDLEGYAWPGWVLEIVETNNRRAKVFESDMVLNEEQKIVEDYMIEGKFFGPIENPTNDNTLTITKLG